MRYAGRIDYLSGERDSLPVGKLSRKAKRDRSTLSATIDGTTDTLVRILEIESSRAPAIGARLCAVTGQHTADAYRSLIVAAEDYVASDTARKRQNFRTLSERFYLFAYGSLAVLQKGDSIAPHVFAKAAVLPGSPCGAVQPPLSDSSASDSPIS